MKKYIEKIKTLLKNLRFLCSHSVDDSSLLKLLANNAVELKFILEQTPMPKILTPAESIRLLKEKPKSLCRFGDGEANLIRGQSQLFQEYDEKLAARLKYLLKNDEAEIYIAIPYCYFADTSMCTEVCRYAIRNNRHLSREYTELCNLDKTYLAAEMTQVYQVYEKYDFKRYFAEVKELFEGKNIVLIHGEGILDNLKYNLLEKAEKISYISAPSKNAYTAENEIVEKVKKDFPVSCLICVILGHAAKSLVYRLTVEGYMAWDLGHWLKDYDAYMNNAARTWKEITKFFQPD